MTRVSTTEKEKIVLKEFQRLLRSGKDYSTISMYKDAGAKCFLEAARAGRIVNHHYQKLISEDMREFVQVNNSLKFDALKKEFAVKFKLCQRESRLIIGYIR